ncbi:MAG: BMP family protein [Armatimonadetes bacterium]|nr:BMP family protein [Armatimonadota bacterium]
MTKFLSFLSLSVLVLAGCSGDSSSSNGSAGGNSATSSADSGTKGGTFKVALLTPGPVNDSGWCALAYDGLQGIKEDMGAEVSNQVAVGNDIKEAMRTYAQKGYNLVFGHGFEYNEPGVQVAKDFPNTVFVSSSGSLTAKNAGAIRFYLEQSFYLAGVLAGKATKTNVVGMVGGPQVPSIESTFHAFKAGAESVNPNIKVLEAFTGENNDVAKAKQAAEQMIGQKADFLIHQANGGAQGVFNACKEGHIWAFGANMNQNDNDSGVVIGSAAIIARPAFLEVAKLVKEGKFDGSTIQLDMQKGAIDFVYNDKLKSQLPADAIAKVEEVKKDILSGKFVVPKDKF